MKKRIILVFGYICSGKTTYCEEYSQKEGYHHLKVSDFVRKRLSTTSRQELTSSRSKALAKDIAIDIVDELGNHTNVVVDGIRQWAIVEFIFKNFQLGEVELRWLEVPKEELRRRFESRQAIKDDLDFDTAYDRDNKLGLKKIRKQIKNLIQIIKNY